MSKAWVLGSGFGLIGSNKGSRVLRLRAEGLDMCTVYELGCLLLFGIGWSQASERRF